MCDQVISSGRNTGQPSQDLHNLMASKYQLWRTLEKVITQGPDGPTGGGTFDRAEHFDSYKRSQGPTWRLCCCRRGQHGRQSRLGQGAPGDHHDDDEHVHDNDNPGYDAGPGAPSARAPGQLCKGHMAFRRAGPAPVASRPATGSISGTTLTADGRCEPPTAGPTDTAVISGTLTTGGKFVDVRRLQYGGGDDIVVR